MFDMPPQEPASAETTAPSDRLATVVPTVAALPNVTLLGYPVSGRNRRAVRAEMNERRPEIRGQRHDARTTWQYNFRVQAPNGVCSPQTAQVSVSITVIMPDLDDPSRLGRTDRAAWDSYIAALALHEGNHARIANLGAEHMQAAMRAAASCSDLQAIIDAQGAEVAAASQQYDSQTRHGATEGAQF